LLWGNRSRQPFRLDRFSNAKYEIDLEYEFQSRIRVIAISEKLFGSNNQQIVLSRSRLLLFPATPEGDERSKDTQSINMFGGNDLVEGERMSGQDVRTNNGAPPFPLRRSVRSKQRPVPVDARRFGGRLRIIARSRRRRSAFARLEPRGRPAGPTPSFRTPRTRPHFTERTRHRAPTPTADPPFAALFVPSSRSDGGSGGGEHREDLLGPRRAG
jgi:hypothetical protein